MIQLSKSNLSLLSHRNQVVFALFCAKQVYHLVRLEDKAVVDACISTIELWFEGKATKEDCRAAAYAADAAYADAGAAAAAYAAAASAAASAAAAYAAAAAASAASASAAAYASATYAAAAAAYSATAAAYAAAAYAASDKQEIIEAQWKHYKELLELDNYLVGNT